MSLPTTRVKAGSLAAALTMSLILAPLILPATAHADNLGANAQSTIPAASLLTVKNATTGLAYAGGQGGGNYNSDPIHLAIPAGQSCPLGTGQESDYWLAPVGHESWTDFNNSANATSGANLFFSGSVAQTWTVANQVWVKLQWTALTASGTGNMSAAAKAGTLTPALGSDPAFGAPLPSGASLANASWYQMNWASATAAGLGAADDFTKGTNPGLHNADGTRTVSLVLGCGDLKTIFYTHITMNPTTKAWAVGDSLASTTPTVTVPGAPAGVTGAVDATTKTTVNASWSAPSSNGGAAVTGYTIGLYNAADNSLVGGSQRMVGATVTSATFANVAEGSKVKVGVAATNSAGTGPVAYSGEVDVAASTSTGSIPVTVTLPKTGISLDIPTGTTAAAGSATAQSDGSFSATATVGQFSVDDTRTTHPGWNLTASLGSFALTSGSGSFTATGDTYTPTLGGAAPGNGAASGSGSTLAKAVAGQGAGVTTVDTKLGFTIPKGTAQGSYSSTLTLTLVGSAA